jgi:hypothetical protein
MSHRSDASIPDLAEVDLSRFDGDGPWRRIDEVYYGGVIDGALHAGRLGVWGAAPSERYRLSAVGCAVRHEALFEIFRILDARTFRQRLLTTRIIVEGITRHHARRIFRMGATEQRTWCDGVATHSDALADLIGEYPVDFAGHIMPHYTLPENAQMAIRILRKWAEYARSYRQAGLTDGLNGWAMPHTRRPRRPPDMRPVDLIDHLAQCYLLATGRRPSRAVSRSRAMENPDPFIHFLGAVWRLAGRPRSADAIIHDVRRWQRHYYIPDETWSARE